jgi:hypothetical protein
VKTFYDSSDFKTAAQQAQPFFRVAHDFVFGRLVSDLKLENVVSALWKYSGASTLIFTS